MRTREEIESEIHQLEQWLERRKMELEKMGKPVRKKKVDPITALLEEVNRKHDKSLYE